MWVLDHFAHHGTRTALAEAFTDAKYPYYHPAVGSQLARYMVESVRVCTPKRAVLRHVEKVVAVPSSKGLSRQLSVELASFFGLRPPARSDLGWNRPVASVKNIPVIERREHLRGAMSAAPIDVGTVLLVDDALQSGATLSEGASAVRRAGAKRIVAIALLAVDGHGN